MNFVKDKRVDEFILDRDERSALSNATSVIAQLYDAYYDCDLISAGNGDIIEGGELSRVIGILSSLLSSDHWEITEAAGVD